ncbi:MAG: hypothetical protein J6V23_06880 [Bacteroidaceae bacterium]|nr:hypothetical protein [Bacteroidaceae bacterium]
MLVRFEYWYSFGKGDYGESSIEMEITEEEYARLQEAEETGDEFYACKMVEDIYNRAYELAEEDATDTLIEEGILDQGRRASEMYPIEVCYP